NWSQPLIELIFNLNFLSFTHNYNGDDIRETIMSWLDGFKRLNWPRTSPPWTTWSIGNYDNSRLASRMGHMLADAIHMIGFMCPQAIPVVYYGDEIGITDVRWSDVSLKAKTENQNYPKRLLTRSPMQWNTNTKSAGFSDNNTTKTWTNVNTDFTQYNVKV